MSKKPKNNKKYDSLIPDNFENIKPVKYPFLNYDIPIPLYRIKALLEDKKGGLTVAEKVKEKIGGRHVY
jgi:hypothetical protein